MLKLLNKKIQIFKIFLFKVNLLSIKEEETVNIKNIFKKNYSFFYFSHLF